MDKRLDRMSPPDQPHDEEAYDKEEEARKLREFRDRLAKHEANLARQGISFYDIDPELHHLFGDLFVCPLCRQKPLNFFEARFDPENPDVLFIMFCKRCDAEVQYSIIRDTIEEVKVDLLKARAFATTSDSQYKAVVPRRLGMTHGIRSRPTTPR